MAFGVQFVGLDLLQVEFLTSARDKFIREKGKGFDPKKFDAEFGLR